MKVKQQIKCCSFVTLIIECDAMFVIYVMPLMNWKYNVEANCMITLEC